MTYLLSYTAIQYNFYNFVPTTYTIGQNNLLLFAILIKIFFKNLIVMKSKDNFASNLSTFTLLKPAFLCIFKRVEPKKDISLEPKWPLYSRPLHNLDSVHSL